MGLRRHGVAVGGRGGAGEGAAVDELRESDRGAVRHELLALGIAAMVLMGLSVSVLIGWEYRPALHGAFVYEDTRAIESCADPAAIGINRAPSGIWMSLVAGRWVTQGLWCAQLARSQPLWAFHLMNLVLHLTATGLVGLLAWRVVPQALGAFVAMLLFGVNAVNVEAVAYLSGRSELVAAIGVLLACLAALDGTWWAVVPAMLIGLGGKESAIVAVALVPLGLWYQRGRPWGLVTVLALTLVLATVSTATPAIWWVGVPPLSWALVQLTAIMRVIGLSLLPVWQTVDYDYAVVPLVVRLFSAVSLGAALVWVWLHRANRLLVYGTAWIVVTVAPRLIVPTPLSVFSEHQAYLAVVGVALVFASVLTFPLPARKAIWT